MSEYLHGAYGDTAGIGNRLSADAASAIVVIGTAPVHTLALASGESYNVNKPVLVRNIAEAKKYFGYSEDWASYTLCEAMHHFFENKAVGPLVLINVLDPATHRSQTKATATKTPAANRVTIAEAGAAILETVEVKRGDTALVKGTDYNIAYSSAKETITITGVTSTSLGTDALTISYYTVTPASVTAAVVVGSTDGAGTNTGVYAVKNVYQLTGVIPAYLMAPGFSSDPTVHAAMIAVSKKINGHWDAYCFVDLPIADGATALTLDSAVTWKNANGYTNENETVYFPMATGTDGKHYHLSVLAAANFLQLLGENDGIPYHSASNTEAGIVQGLWIGTGSENKVFDDEIINEKLNKNGVASAAYVGGRWVIWGAHSADYNQDDADQVNVSETSRMMLYYISNDFQHRRPQNVDRPLTANDIATIVAEEQQRLDALKAIGALLYGEATLDAESIADSDVYNGDFVFEFRVTTTPLAKSLKAIVAWVDDGFATYFDVDMSQLA